MANRATLKVMEGPNTGDSVKIERGSCRLIGRHLSEAETAFIDRDGCRILDGSAAGILTDHLQDRSPEITRPSETSETAAAPEPENPPAFERGPDIIFADDSISRAHAMVFFDDSGFGIIDLASTNGTFVQEERVTSALVEPGMRIGVGNSELALEINA